MNITKRLEEENLKYVQQELARMAAIRAIPKEMDGDGYRERVAYILNGQRLPAELSPWLLK